MAPRDAQMLWLSERVPSDQFLLFAFANATESAAELEQFVIGRARRIDDLGIRVSTVPGNLDFPYWAPHDPGPDQVVEHELADSTWTGLTAAVADLFGDPLDTSVSPWRLHIFCDVVGAPGCNGAAVVAVLQISHALADGRRASAIARALFGSDEPAPMSGRRPAAPPAAIAAALGAVRLPIRTGHTLVRGIGAYSAQRELARLVDAGELPPENPGLELAPLNADPGPARVRMIICSSTDLRAPGITVTVSVLTAISSALAAFLSSSGRLGAEVTVAMDSDTGARNNFRNVGVDLFPDESNLLTRAHLISDALEQRRLRARHPAATAQGKVTRALPAPMLRAEIAGYPLDQVPPTVSGNTVVSSVFRGAADLRLAGGSVQFTAGFPALSSVMGLTHGVHGIGDTVTVSITAGQVVLPDIDRYEQLLRGALTDVAQALRMAPKSGA
ncbi:wax ester/triacylglycerol synthase domain-containing protein [Antrihabitans cavernicola]